MKWIIGLMLVLGACPRRGFRRVVGPGLLLLFAAACSKREEKITLTGAKVDASPTPREAEMRDAAQRWNRAMSQRDLSLLAGVYGAKVTFQGVPMRHDQVLQVLSDAFVKDPSFTQSIDDVKPGQGADMRVRLKRTWVTTGTSHTEPAWLELSREGGKLLVTAQGDATSDARIAARAQQPKKDRCEDLAQRVVMSTQRATALVHAPGNGYPNESYVAASPPEWPTYVVTVIDHTTQNPVAIGWFDVVAATGEVSDAFTGETLEPNEDLIAEMRKCKP